VLNIQYVNRFQGKNQGYYSVTNKYKDTNRWLGQKGEALVAAYVAERGYKIIASNVRWQRGEIDLIVQKGITVACVEVKTRRSDVVPMGLLVSLPKQRRIIMTARYFLQKQDMHDCIVRFDVALVTWSRNRPKVTYIENAFCVEK